MPLCYRFDFYNFSNTTSYTQTLAASPNKMTTRLLTAVLFLTIIGCNQKTDKRPETADCKPYFPFDKVEYYSIDFHESKLWELEEKENKTNTEIRLLNVLLKDKPDQIPDTVEFNNLETLGFKKKEIEKDKFQRLEKIFCERKHEEALYTSCIAVYRDILIFKRQNKTIGFARLCFECGDSIIAGTDKDWSEFGQSGDFQRLGAILEN